MRIAIIGGGFAGLAAAYFLAPHASIVLFAQDGGASSLASGLLHPYVGREARLAQLGPEGMHTTRELLEALGPGLANPSGLLRPAVTEEQHEAFLLSHRMHPSTEWWEREQCAAYGIEALGGLFIPEALQVEVPAYLAALERACHSRGVSFRRERVESLASLAGYDATVIAAGAESLHFPELAHLPMTQIKGQVVDFALPLGWPMPPFPLASHSYLCLAEGRVRIGATYERHFASPAPDGGALPFLQERVATFFPAICELHSVRSLAGVRLSLGAPHLPRVEQVGERLWVFTGLGSRGLLYHAHFAQKLIRSLSKPPLVPVPVCVPVPDLKT